PDLGAPYLPAAAVDFEYRDRIAAKAAGFVAEGDDVSRSRAHLRVRREGLLTPQLAVERIYRFERLQGVEIERGGRTVLLQREEQVLVLDDVSVGRAATESLDAWVVQGRVAIHRHQSPARPVLRKVALRSHVAGAIVDAAAPDPEQPHVPLTVEGDVSRRQGILRIRPNRVEPTAQALWNLSVDFTVAYVDFGAQRSVSGAIGSDLGHGHPHECDGLAEVSRLFLVMLFRV